MNKPKYNLLLADDDEDDCAFFKDALDDLHLSVSFNTVANGVALMKYLSDNSPGNLPDILFLDLNMPRKNGTECLVEIKQNDRLKNLPVIIISTSFEHDVVNSLYKDGADFYLCKPGDFSVLKQRIYSAVNLVANLPFKPRSKDKFVVNAPQAAQL